MDEDYERALILLGATVELLRKQKESVYVLNMLEETVYYDGVDCDGACLLADIEAYLGIGE